MRCGLLYNNRQQSKVGTITVPFVKGQSGNPGGRSKGLERRVREMVEPDMIIETVLGIMLDDGADRKDRIAAAKLLSERGWGRPRQTVEVTEVPQSRYDYSLLTPQQLDTLEALLSQCEVGTEGDGAP
jgi:hypothetical protein